MSLKQGNKKGSGVNQHIRILTVHSTRDLFKYKSFFLLIFLLIAADRLLHRYVSVDGLNIQPGEIIRMGEAAAQFVFTVLPDRVADLLFDYRTILVIAGMFLMKQIISLWPSSDMRRMHRSERKGFGIFGSLLALRWRQVLWDATAVGSVCMVGGLWMLAWFMVCQALWQRFTGLVWLLLWVVAAMAVAPVVMAGFSYSSKIAVISRGRFFEKLGLFFKLFKDPGLFWPSWIFFSVRISLEFIFVVAIPGFAILFIPVAWLRILVAGVSATVVYSYLKMATFKFFLQLYRKFPQVQQEYASYYETLADKTN